MPSVFTVLVGKSTSTYVPVFIDAAATGITSPTVTYSTGGAAWTSLHDGAWSEIGNGWYAIHLDTTDTASVRNMLLKSYDGVNPAGYVMVCVEDWASHGIQVSDITSNSLFKQILAQARGKVTKSGSDYTFYDTDNTTPLFTLSYATNQRTVS